MTGRHVGWVFVYALVAAAAVVVADDLVPVWAISEATGVAAHAVEDATDLLLWAAACVPPSLAVQRVVERESNRAEEES